MSICSKCLLWFYNRSLAPCEQANMCLNISNQVLKRQSWERSFICERWNAIQPPSNQGEEEALVSLRLWRVFGRLSNRSPTRSDIQHITAMESSEVMPCITKPKTQIRLMQVSGVKTKNIACFFPFIQSNPNETCGRPWCWWRFLDEG